MNIYKIRRKSDGLYSEAGAGGPWVGFSKIGKSWHHLRHVITHMNSVNERSVWHKKPNPYGHAVEVVQFELLEKTIIMIMAKAPKKKAV